MAWIVETFRAEPKSSRFWIVVLAWIASMVLTPIGLQVWGEAAFPVCTSVTVLLHAAASLIALTEVRSKSWVLGRFVWILLAATAIEALGSKTGFPFGRYHYTSSLQPQIFSVPVLIPLAWPMMLIPAWGIASALLGDRKPGARHTIVFALVSALAFTAWDFFLDPHMVANGLWIWDQPGGYYGIPWSNFLGWLLSAALITGISRPEYVESAKLVLIYTSTWIFQWIAQIFFWDQPGPAWTGFLLMGVFVALAWRSNWMRSLQSYEDG
jgi:putative membrane protein